jgi:hypothetical protein
VLVGKEHKLLTASDTDSAVGSVDFGAVRSGGEVAVGDSNAAQIAVDDVVSANEAKLDEILEKTGEVLLSK